MRARPCPHCGQEVWQDSDNEETRYDRFNSLGPWLQDVAVTAGKYTLAVPPATELVFYSPHLCRAPVASRVGQGGRGAKP